MVNKLSNFDKLLDECSQSGVNVEQGNLPENIHAIYYDDKDTEPIVVINELLKTQSEQTCALAEELGHYHTSCGNLLTDKSIDKAIIRKQEYTAKKWAVQRLITIKSIIRAYEAGCRNLFEMAEYLNVTRDFLLDAFKKYNSIYGKYKERGNYIVCFDPPGVLKKIE